MKKLLYIFLGLSLMFACSDDSGSEINNDDTTGPSGPSGNVFAEATITSVSGQWDFDLNKRLINKFKNSLNGLVACK